MKIIISTQGGWGHSKLQDKEMVAQTVKAALERNLEKGSEVYSIEIVGEISHSPEKSVQADILIFLSRSEIEGARQIKLLHPEKRVVVLTGLIPKNEVVVVALSWVGGATLADFILRGQEGLI